MIATYDVGQAYFILSRIRSSMQDSVPPHAVASSNSPPAPSLCPHRSFGFIQHDSQAAATYLTARFLRRMSLQRALVPRNQLDPVGLTEPGQKN